MNIQVTHNLEDFKAALEQANASGTIRVRESGHGRWTLCIDHRLGDKASVSLWVTCGRHEPNLDPADAWPTHADALAKVRDTMQGIYNLANDLNLRVDACLDVTQSVQKHSSKLAPLASAAGRRLAAIIAWTKRPDDSTWRPEDVSCTG